LPKTALVLSKLSKYSFFKRFEDWYKREKILSGFHIKLEPNPLYSRIESPQPQQTTVPRLEMDHSHHDHAAHMAHAGHGGHGDMDMGGQCNMNVRFTLALLLLGRYPSSSSKS